MSLIKVYRVKIRRNLGKVKPSADLIDGKLYSFVKGWAIDVHESSLYGGEFAMCPCDKHYPEGAPPWIASGDLQEVC